MHRHLCLPAAPFHFLLSGDKSPVVLWLVLWTILRFAMLMHLFYTHYRSNHSCAVSWLSNAPQRWGHVTLLLSTYSHAIAYQQESLLAHFLCESLQSLSLFHIILISPHSFPLQHVLRISSNSLAIPHYL